MRDGSLARISICALVLIGCRSGTGPSSERSDPATARSESASVEPSASAKPDRPATLEPSREAAEGPEHAERVADLELLCRALDHDYVDGTLSDYYAKLEPKTAWGRERMREGDESMTPGRLLQQAATQIAASLESPELAGCRKLFDELDELE